MPEETRKLYLEDTYLFDGDAVVQRVEPHATGREVIILNQTIFYPQGGGQPFDQGFISTEAARFEVQEARLAGGQVQHIGRLLSGCILPGESVRLEVDQARRLLNARIHSAGELICAGVRSLGHSSWYVSSAIHFPDHANVEYEVELLPDACSRLRETLEERVNSFISAGDLVNVEILSDRSEVARRCGFVPNYIPESESVRVVTVWGELGRPCQGTHVKDIREIGLVSIRKVKSKKGRTSISYSVC